MPDSKPKSDIDWLKVRRGQLSPNEKMAAKIWFLVAVLFITAIVLASIYL